MTKRPLLIVPIAAGFLFLGGRVTGAQDDTTNIRVNVDLVQLNVAVTDNKGNYISGLGPENFAITEDKIPERIATFEEGNEPARQVLQAPPNAAPAKPGAPSAQPAAQTKPVMVAAAPEKGHPGAVGEDPATLPSQVAGDNVLVLFDTSN